MSTVREERLKVQVQSEQWSRTCVVTWLPVRGFRHVASSLTEHKGRRMQSYMTCRSRLCTILRWVRLWSVVIIAKPVRQICAINTPQVAQADRMLSPELTPGRTFGRMSGQRSRMNLGMAMKRVLGHNRARPARRSQSVQKWCSIAATAGARQTSLFLGTPPEVVPAPLGSPVWAVPAQCEFQNCPPVWPVPKCPGACSARCSPHHPFTIGAGTSRCGGLAGWNIPTPPSTVTSNPPV